MADAALTFVSWVRRGLATALQATEGDAPGPQTLAEVIVRFNADDLSARANLDLVGPGDIVGLDSSVVVRTWPRPEDLDAEFVAYPLIEFDQADLPWRYSPARNSGDPVTAKDDHLRPWFSLVVLATDEGSITPPTPERKIALLNVSNIADLPAQANLWAWAHTQFEGQEINDPNDYELANRQIKGQPGLSVARLLSPRLLRSNVEYIACLVPTFERGRLAGLGKLAERPDTDSLLGWDLADLPFQLPIYYSWRFRTGTIGNFEQAARLIKSFVLPATIGRRDMDAGDPGLDLVPAANGSLPVEGALMSVAAFHDGAPPWPTAERDPFIADLKELLNAPAQAAPNVDPVLAPPLYGEWYAAESTLNGELPHAGGPPCTTPPCTNPPWYYQLNSDPRNRVAAALGTKVIQNEQQALLSGAWEQVEEIDSINEKLRVLQAARGILTRIWLRHFVTTDRQLFFHLTLRLHSRVVCGDRTVCQRIVGSPIVPGFMSATWLRLSRPQGPVGRLQGRPELPGTFTPNLLDLLNQCKRPAGDPDQPPGGTHDTGNHPLPGGLPCEIVDELVAAGTSVNLFWGLVILWVARKLLVTRSGDCWWIGLKALRIAIGLIFVSISGPDVQRRCRFRNGALSVADILGSPPMPTFSGLVSIPTSFPSPPLPGTTADNAQAAAVRAALGVLHQVFVPPPVLPCLPPMDLAACHTELVAQLVPSLTVGERIADRITIDPSVEWDPIDPLEPILVVPEFERPMYEPLKAISYDWLLPGLNQIERDTVGLAVTNQRFVEAYMVGLNHEMTRELLWNEFPTDQRGTYFRQFWSIAGHILEDGSTLSSDELRDIEVLRLWNETANLGDNSPRPAAPGDPSAPFLVLVVRAQLIRKYPNVIVYAQRLDATTQTLVGKQEHPIFYAMLEPDVAFYGFQLTEQEVRTDPRWYFVLQEQPGEPKFADETAYGVQPKTTPDPTVVNNSAGSTSAGLVAERAFLQPFRLGIQATTLLPTSAP